MASRLRGGDVVEISYEGSDRKDIGTVVQWDDEGKWVTCYINDNYSADFRQNMLRLLTEQEVASYTVIGE